MFENAEQIMSSLQPLETNKAINLERKVARMLLIHKETNNGIYKYI